MNAWLALVIGNTRLHWALFTDDTFITAWHTPPLTQAQILGLNAHNFHADAWSRLWPQIAQQTMPQALTKPLRISAIYLASVVPQQTGLWQSSLPASLLKVIDHPATPLPLQGLYPTMGCDRILNLWGAGITYGWPTLVIDSGTALTYTAGIPPDSQTPTSPPAIGKFIGGAILPGLRPQFKALQTQTAALPEVRLPAPDQALSLWASDTPSAMQSGILHTILAGVQYFIASWRKQYPDSTIVFTGGDGAYLYDWVQTLDDALEHPIFKTTNAPAISTGALVDELLMFWGIRAFKHHRNDES
jgi:type III pantothenate kinase